VLITGLSGSTHDKIAAAWSLPLRQFLDGLPAGCVVLGDTVYRGLHQRVITPVINNGRLTAANIAYNNACTRIRELHELFDCYDTTLADLLDKHAPWRSIVPKAKPSAPCFDVECHSAKVATRRFEKAYQKNPSSSTKLAWRKQFDFLCTLFQGKFTKHWSDAISSCNGDYKAIWSRLQPLLNSDTKSSSRLTVDDFARYFTDKIDRIRTSTFEAPPPVIIDRPVTEPLSVLRPTTVDEVAAILKKSAAKQCQLDLVPSW